MFGACAERCARSHFVLCGSVDGGMEGGRERRRSVCVRSMIHRDTDIPGSEDIAVTVLWIYEFQLSSHTDRTVLTPPPRWRPLEISLVGH